jgi:hypothetical protein
MLLFVRGIAPVKEFDMRKALSLLSVIGLVIAAGPVAAHHSFALFDMNKTVSLEGTVKAFEWSNPHTWITLAVANEQNTTEDWLVELPSAGTLARDGWNKNYIKAGEKLILRVNPLKDGRKGGSLQSFTPSNRPDPSP